MTAAVLGVAVVSLALLGAGGVVVRRRRVLGLVLVGVGIAGIVVGDVVPRLLATREVTAECLTADVEPVGSPLAWQAATGGVLVEVRVTADDVVEMIDERLAATPIAGADVHLEDDGVEVAGEIDSPFGPLSVTGDLRPSVVDERLTWGFGSLLVGGREVPPALRDRIAGAAGTTGGSAGDPAGGDDGSCGAGGAGRGAVRSASIDASGLVLRVAL